MNATHSETLGTLGFVIFGVLGWAYTLTMVSHALLTPTLG